MAHLHRHIAAPLAVLLACFAFTLASCAAEVAPTDPDSPGNPQLEQAAQAVADAAKESIAAAKSDQDAVRRAQLALNILVNVGELGGFDTSPQIEKLMDDLRATAQPSVVETIVQMQFANNLRQWQQLSDEGRAAALENFVADIKKTGLTFGYAESLARLAGMYGDRDQSGLIAKAIADVLPTAKPSNDLRTMRMFRMLEGIGRRLDLVGKPLELEGKLLDGSTLNWADYRGKVVLVDFFASWCGPCRAEVPNVLKNYQAYHAKGFEVIGVNLDVDPRAAERYIQETGADFPTIFSDDPNAKGWETPMAVKYGINAIPRVMLVGKDGKVISTSARGAMLAEMLEKLLGPADGGDAGDEAAKSSGLNRSRQNAQAPRSGALR